MHGFVERNVQGLRGLLMLIVRQEEPNDYGAVYRVVKEAFSSAEHSDGNEQDLVVALRKSKAFCP